MSFNITSLHEKIDVYHNVIQDSSVFMDNVLSIKEDLWKPWGGFGHYTTLITRSYSGEPHEFNTDTKESDLNKVYVSTQFGKIFKDITSDYIKRNKFELPNWHSSDPQLCKYFPKAVKYTGLILPFHTDYQQERESMPGIKHGITANLYINDNYEGGEILYQVEPNEEIISYKPKAGDILVFPSTEPYFHGVRVITKGEKFFIRNFIQHYFDGTPEWLGNQRHFGAYRWAKMESDRIEKENPKNMRYSNRKHLGYES